MTISKLANPSIAQRLGIFLPQKQPRVNPSCSLLIRDFGSVCGCVITEYLEEKEKTCLFTGSLVQATQHPSK